ncbi:RNA polymerase sigma factor [Parabacteroides goldsteinii]|jgi:RNA polymerase sigma factor (sigma-70 family)|uniref:RNA polymerase sigma70 factor n=2 Tax=Parabacteroides goldsteinii TaxID=328812 RepID=A0A0J6CEF3_9BACT|nr:sigma-70 family RNA polymerase sigma factor [Parabacteroides goldsteinii]KKB58189.1 sigma-70 family RNA polymerase sigma factor [Parabacteroides goldsteinii DSM 19448 = WAL 12034]KMM31563.1 RNA polymerase sigma70 factor [Parabacteroides goldsteinii]MBS6575058.1 sigma-70 family RNA polymerase sigma factor [Parabacteroides goldsteinii]
MQEDESKIKWCQFIAGDKEAYSWIYKVYIQMLFQYGKRFTSDTELIKDCIQEVFTKLYNNRKHLVIPDNIKLYLLISLKNCLINTICQESHYERYNSETISFSLELTVEEQYVNNEHYQNQLKRIREILALLTPRQKEIIYYRYIQELSFDEICVIMDINYQSAQNLIQRSLKKIRDTYGSVEVFLLLLSISVR